MHDLTESKTILVTGATDGIGLATAVELSRLGHRIVIHGRRQDRLATALQHVQDAGARTDHISVRADLAEFDSVLAMSTEVLQGVEVLDVLINNAGVFRNERDVTAEGIELTFAINHLSHFLLTHQLVDLLRRSRPSRIINVSSVAHRRGRIDFDDIGSASSYGGYEAYASSKLANVLFTRSLASRLGNDEVTANALHPGVIDTKLLRAGFSMKGSSVREGAATSVYLATAGDVSQVSGKYFANSAESSAESHALDAEDAERLWQMSIELIRRSHPDWSPSL